MKKNLFWVKKLRKVEKSSKKFRKSSEKVQKFQKLFQTFQELRKNDVQLELQKSQKTCSDSKTHSKVWLKVQNAGP